jgi:hypothetical protein
MDVPLIFASSQMNRGLVVAQQKRFGTCCKDMRDALTLPEQRFLFVQEGTGVLFLTVGGVKTDQGIGWFDQAVLFCPFCGTQLQMRDEIKLATTQLPEGHQEN